MDERNQFDTRGDCAERGLRAEERFAALARARGYHLTPASSAQNIHEHWDWLMVRDEERLRVDVKAQKRLSRQDAGVQDAWVWVELHGVRPYDRGWLYDGQADLLVFEQRASFLLVVRRSRPTSGGLRSGSSGQGKPERCNVPRIPAREGYAVLVSPTIPPRNVPHFLSRYVIIVPQEQKRSSPLLSSRG
jgi:hypothetical protein